MLFRLHLLGRLRVTDASGDDIGLPAGKPFALLALVALEESRVSRSDLANLLWPATARERANASVRQAIWTLRKHLGPDVIGDRDDGTLALNTAILATDLEPFAEALDRGDLDAIAARWKGGPLRGLVLADAQGWNRWAAEIHASWQSRVGRRLEHRASELPARERLAWIEEALAVRPGRESMHVLKVQTLLELGRLEEATGALDLALSRLGTDATEALLGMETRLETALREHYVSESTPSLEPSFVGRGMEFGRLAEALRSSGEGHATRTAILGPPGIGKTRLAQEFILFARASGIRVVEARATPADRLLQFGIASTVIRELLKMSGAAGISPASAEALRSIVPSSAAGTGFHGGVAAAAIGDALLDLLDAVADEGPVIILVDDAQWMDRDSRIVLHRTTAILSVQPLLILETYRTGYGTASSPIRALERDVDAGLASMIELSPLSPEDVTQLVVELSPAASEAAAAHAGDMLHQASHGYPLHLVELLRKLRDDRVLERCDDRWELRLDGLSARLEAPAGLQELILGRLEGLSEDAQELLGELARAQGRPQLDALKVSSRLSGARFDEAASELFRAHVVRWVEKRSVAFSHELLREAVLSHRSRGRRSLLRSLPIGLGVVIALTMIGRSTLTRADLDPFSGAVLTLRYDTVLYTYGPGPAGAWQRESSFVGSSDTGSVRPHFFLGTGQVVGQLRPADRGPDIASSTSDGSVRLLLDGGGDDGLLDLSPDGSSLLVAVEDESAPEYRLDLELLDLETGRRSPLLAPDVRAYASWSPSGREILAAVVTMDDSDFVVRMRPDGSEVMRFALPPGQVSTVRPCGDSRALVRLAEPRQLPRWRILDWNERELRALPTAAEQELLVACTPRGDFVVLVDPDEGALRAYELAEPGEERVMPLRPPPGGSPGGVTLKWRQVVVPASVTGVAPDSIAWGAEASLEAEVLARDGTRAQGTIEWIPLDPDVLNVRDNMAIANRPGVGRAILRVDGWLTDTIRVVVTGEPVEALQLADDFQGLLDHWTEVGEPQLELVTTPDGRALALGGDGIWNDGLESRASFARDQGLTAEVQFRLPLTDRDDRQSIKVCLQGDPDALSNSPRRQGPVGTSMCASFPQGERQSFDSDALSMQMAGEVVLGYEAPGLGSGEWVSLGLQLRPDGQFSAIANGREVGTFPVPAPPGRENLRLVIYGRSQDTQLLVRSATVWKGARY